MFGGHWIFEDKTPREEFSEQGDRVEYKPWGVITCAQWPMDREDGQCIGVIFKSPSGRIFRQWRSLKEIGYEEVDKERWKAIYDLMMMSNEKVAQKSGGRDHKNKESNAIH